MLGAAKHVARGLGDFFSRGLGRGLGATVKTEKQNMESCEPYWPFDRELIEAHQRARVLCDRYNRSSPFDQAARDAILKELLAPGSGIPLIEPPLRVDYGCYTKFGKGCYANFDLLILDSVPVEIGDGVWFGPSVRIYGSTHPLDCKARESWWVDGKPIKIGSGSWIGGSAVICPGVTVGEGAVVAAGSVITQDVPRNAVMGGNPARVLRIVPNDV
jgi:maltose O-acetyltransferase